MKHEIKQIDDFAVVISDNEIEGIVLVENGNTFIIGKVITNYETTVEIDLNWATTQLKSKSVCKKIIATIGKQIEGLPMLELPNIQRIEVLLKPEHIELLEQGNKIVGKDKTEYNIPQKFINENDKWYIELPNQEDDIKKLAKEHSTSPDEQHHFIAGYKAAQSKKWSDEDVYLIAQHIGNKYFREGKEIHGKMAIAEYPSSSIRSDIRTMLQSLQKKQFPIAVDLEIEEYPSAITSSGTDIGEEGKDWEWKTRFKPLKWYYE